MTSPVPVAVMLDHGTECQALARALGDRQNSDSTLTGRLATRLVNALLNAGNTLTQIAKDVAQADYEKAVAAPETANVGLDLVAPPLSIPDQLTVQGKISTTFPLEGYTKPDPSM